VTGTVRRASIPGKDGPSFNLTRILLSLLNNHHRLIWAFVLLTHFDSHPLRAGCMSSRANEEQDGGSTPKRGRRSAAPQHMQPPPGIPPPVPPAELHVNDPPLSGAPTLPKTRKQQCYCLACGDTSTHQFRNAPVGFKVAIVLILGEEIKNFNGQVDVCRACERSLGTVLPAECEALVVVIDFDFHSTVEASGAPTK